MLTLFACLAHALSTEKEEVMGVLLGEAPCCCHCMYYKQLYND